MTPHALFRLPVLCPAAALIFCSLALPAAALDFKLFKKAEKQVPGASERQAQEAQATAMLAEARMAESAGRGGKAQDLYKKVVKQYPFTNAAAEASYANALSVRQNGRVDDAFDEFQKFIEQYRSSPRFNDALQQQYELAEEAKGGKRTRSLLIIPTKVGGEDLVDLYKKIIANAPFGRLAPLAQFSIAEIYQDMGEKDKAVLAYQTVVDNYPTTKQASEAQFRIGSVSSVAAKKSEDKSNLTATRDALTAYMVTHPKGERTSEAEMILNQVNEAEAKQSLEVGKFYERMNKTKAAAIYYNEALKFGSPEVSAEARQLLAKLAAADPEAVADAKKGQPNQDYTVRGAQNLRSRSDYVGPVSPDLARLSQKPKMRTGSDDFMPIPLQEPTLPTKPAAGSPPADSLLPPVPLDRPALLTVPPLDTPGIPPQPKGALPVPPKPKP